jgi:ABC-2 type transport system permease protein
MNKVKLVAFEEIRRAVFTKTFILVLLSVPFFIVMMIMPGIIMEELSKNDLPIGYVDRSGLLDAPRELPIEASDRQIDLLAFPTSEQATVALDAGELQAFFILHDDYLSSRRVDLIFREQPDSDATRRFYDFLQLNLLDHLPEQVAWRAADRADITIRNPEGTRNFTSAAPPLGSVLPIFLGLAIGGLVLTGAGSLMSGLVDEKSNRTIEVVTTSISSSRMITGKLFGIITVSLVQLAFWILVGVAVIWFAGGVLGVEWFQDPVVDWSGFASVLAVAIPSFVLASAVMFALGATVVDAQEGQAIGPILFMVFMIPVYSLLAIANEPHGGLAVTLSLLPLTSILAIGLRGMLAVVPTWQIVASMLIQTVCAVVAIWLAGKAFRLGMLRYGQRLRLRELIGRSRV